MNFGKGLDVGTSNLVAMQNDGSGNDIVTSVRDCYIQLDENELDISQKYGDWKLAKIHDMNVALADDALTVANWTKKPLQRPMAKGVINPTDDVAMEVLAELISKALGKPSKPGEICVASIPADSSDGIDTIAHKGAVKAIVTGLGYKFLPINEGFATLMAMAPSLTTASGEVIPFTGIAISFGGGMINMCFGYRAQQQGKSSLSVSKSGDWIDKMTADFFGTKDGRPRVQPSEVTVFKERYFKFGWEPTDEEIEALGYHGSERRQYFRKMLNGLNMFYQHVIDNVVVSFGEVIKNSNDISIDTAVEVVIAGGTCSPDGFEQKLLDSFEENEFPIAISGIRKAAKDEVMYCTAKGAYIKAMAKEQEIASKQAATPAEQA